MKPGRKQVGVFMDPKDIDYMMSEMLPATAPFNIGMTATGIIERAIEAHRQACRDIRTPPPKVGWPTRNQMMGGK